MTAKSRVEQKILQCIEDGLQPLEAGGQHLIYHYLENHFGLKREDIPKKPEMFCKGLALIFGEKGADIIEKWIVEKLRRSFNLKHPSKITFVEAVKMVKTRQKCLDGLL